jgi:hypothetical protein
MLERLHREMFRRMTDPVYHAAPTARPGRPEAAQFVKRCVDRGVPHELIFGNQSKVTLYVSRAIGMGSLGVKYDVTNQLMSILGMLPDEIGRNNVIRDYIATRAGHQNVDRYCPTISRDKVPSNESSIAVLENNDMAEGVPVQVGSDQLHKAHIDVVVQGLIVPMIQGAQSGQPPQDPVRARQTLDLAVRHTGEHVRFLGADRTRKAYLDSLEPILQMAQRLIAQLDQMIAKMQQEQQRQQQQAQQTLQQADQVVKDRELEARIYEINKKYQLEVMKQASLNQMRADKTREQMDIRRTQADADIALKATRTQADIEINRARAAAEGAALAGG